MGSTVCTRDYTPYLSNLERCEERDSEETAGLVGRATTGRFNATILSRPACGKTTMLASPVLGTGIPLDFFDLEFLRGPRERAAAIDSVLDALQRSGRKLQMDDKPLESPEELHRAINERATFFFDELLPFLRLIGVAD